MGQAASKYVQLTNRILQQPLRSGTKGEAPLQLLQLSASAG
jgi:hypothetical protein